jgi:hypothetical protein
VTRDRVEASMQWVARARPKTDRIACPWLVRRFIDPDAEFVFAWHQRQTGAGGR